MAHGRPETRRKCHAMCYTKCDESRSSNSTYPAVTLFMRMRRILTGFLGLYSQNACILHVTDFYGSCGSGGAILYNCSRPLHDLTPP